MMLNAQRMIEERKKALSIPSSGVQKNNSKDRKPQITTDFEKQAKIAQLQVINYLKICLLCYFSCNSKIFFSKFNFCIGILGSNSKEVSYWYYKDSSKCT